MFLRHHLGTRAFCRVYKIYFPRVLTALLNHVYLMYISYPLS